MSNNQDDLITLEDQPAWLQSYIQSPSKRQQLYRRTLIIVVISQIFGGAGLAAGITVGALLAQEMLNSDSVTGVPVALITLGSALAALIVGRLSDQYGRRIGLATGFLAGGIGALGVVIAAITGNVILLFVSFILYGAGTATNLLARYAGTDMAPATKRATAISIALVSTTLGAVAGPNLVDDMGRFALAIGAPSLSGIFILAAVAFIIAGMVLLILLRPDPLLVAKAIADMKKKEQGYKPNQNSIVLAVNKRGVVVGATIMVLTQVVMVAIMTMTPIHMKHHGHSLSDVGLVIGIHVGAMYLPSLLTGMLVDKVGRITMAIASGVTLLTAGVLASVAPADSMLMLIVALALLGIGWNFGLISGTTLIVDSTSSATRAKTQGMVDVTIALSGASSGAMAGIVVANSSFGLLSVAGGILSLAFIPVLIWSRKKSSSKENTMSQ